MNITRPFSVPLRVFFSGVLLCVATLIATHASAATGKKNPTSKVYVADLSGQSQIDTGEKIEDLAKKSVYNAQGTVIETRSKSTNTMVFSNGTGAYFEEDTRVEIKTFAQEPFTPNRTDMDVEPSISQTRAFVARGSVGLCTSKLVAGSNMIYRTAQGSVNVRGKRVVIAAGDRETKISMIEGDSTVKGGDLDLGGQTLKAGQQAIIRDGPPGQPNTIEIRDIPADEREALDEKVTLACMAKKTVYFEVREMVVTESQAATTAEGQNSSPDSSAPSVFNESNGNGTRSSPINLTPGTQSATGPVIPLITTVTEIVPVEVVPSDNNTTPVSASRLPTLSPSSL
jgi:hypothetical protein